MGKPIVGFANGVFDCFHDGHRHFLRECVMNCDRLVVAINTDAMAMRLKDGIEDGWVTRAENVGQDLRFECDEIASFSSEKGLLKLIKRYKPDVIFKGEDYYGRPITGGALARIHWVARHPGYSSTIERAKR